MHCDVVMVGYRLNAKEPAAKALERILGLPPEVARRLARAFPVTVVEGARDSDAARIRTELEAAGALVELRSLSSTGLAPVRPANEQTEPAPRVAQRLTPDPAHHAHAGARREHGPSAGSRLTPEPMPSMNAPIGAELSSSTAARVTPEPARPADLERSGELLREPRPAPGSSSAGAGYQLGEFGFERTRPISSAPPSAPPPPRSHDVSLDLELASGLPLELEPQAARPELDFGGVDAPAPDLHSLGERFEELEPTRAPRSPDIEARVPRPVQRISRGHESRRPVPGARTKRALSGTLGAWLPSLALLAVLSAGTIAAVGYALDPGDVMGALRREGALPAFTSEPQNSHLHPLLRVAPAAARAALAAVLRARIAGVHDVPVSFEDGSKTVQCALVEQAPGETEARLAQVRETGHEVAPPSAIMAQLREHARALRTASPRAELELTPICLAL